MCKDHTDQIKAKLGISGVLTEEYAWSSKGDEDLRNKIESFRESTGTNKSIQLVMVTTYGVKENKYSGIVGNQVLLDDLFNE